MRTANENKKGANNMNYCQENIDKQRKLISEENFYHVIKNKTIEWAKQKPVAGDDFLETIFKNTISGYSLNRVKSYCLLALIADSIYDAELMTESIDTIVDWLNARLIGDCSENAVFTFPEAPQTSDICLYARNYSWTFGN